MSTSVTVCGTQCPQIYPISYFHVNILWMVNYTIPISLVSLAHVHCQSISIGVHIQAMWTSSAVVSSQPAISLHLPFSLPPPNANTHLVPIWYGRACSSQASCNHLRHCCTFLSTCNLHFNNMALLVLTEHLVNETLRDKWQLAPLRDTENSSENHTASLTYATEVTPSIKHTHIHKAVRNAAQYLCCH